MIFGSKTKQICQNPPECFGEIVFMRRENDCDNCAFYEICEKVGDAVAHVRRMSHMFVRSPE
jgi:hypothetical protein